MIPEKIFGALSRLVMGAKEWRILMVILSATFGSKKKSAVISLDNFVEATKIKKPHVCHAISNLEERNVINKTTFKATTVYSLQEESQALQTGVENTIDLILRVVHSHLIRWLIILGDL